MPADQEMVNLHQPPIASGRTAEVFALGSGQVLKLYRPEMPGEWRDYEAKVGRIVMEAGLATNEEIQGEKPEFLARIKRRLANQPFWKE